MLTAMFVVGVSVAAQPSMPPDRFDWFLLQLDVSVENETMDLSVRISGHLTASDPSEASAAVVGDATASSASLFGGRIGDGQLGVGVASPDGVQRVTVTQLAGGASVSYSYTATDVLAEDLMLLIGVSGGHLDTLEVSVATSDGVEVVRTDHYGLGTSSLRPVDDGSSGAAAQMGPAAAGSTTYSASASTPLIGAFLSDGCGLCQVAFKDSIDRTFEGLSVRHAQQAAWLGDSWFSSPSGDWSIDWTGLRAPEKRDTFSIADTVMAIYVPLPESLAHNWLAVPPAGSMLPLTATLVPVA